MESVTADPGCDTEVWLPVALFPGWAGTPAFPDEHADRTSAPTSKAVIALNLPREREVFLGNMWSLLRRSDGV
jgi:hypothetical protein